MNKFLIFLFSIKKFVSLYKKLFEDDFLKKKYEKFF